MSLELRLENNRVAGRSKKCTGVYLERRRVGEIINFGSMAVFRSGDTSRSFPSDLAARKWVEDTYKASQQGPKPKADTRPTASAAPPPKNELPRAKPPEPDTRPAFPDHPDEIERTIYSIMRDCGDLEVTPPDTDLPLLTLDDVLWAGTNHLLGQDPRNGGTVLQAKRMMVNAAIRRLGHFLPPDFDQTARRNRLLQNHVVAVKERQKEAGPALAQALMQAIERKPDLVEVARQLEPEPAPASMEPPGYGEQPDFDDLYEPFDIADYFEDAELAAENPPELAPDPAPDPAPEPKTYEKIAALAVAPPKTSAPPSTEKPRRAPGKRGPNAKFTAQQTREIRAKFWHGEPAEKLSTTYGTSPATVYRIVEGTYIPRPEA